MPTCLPIRVPTRINDNFDIRYPLSVQHGCAYYQHIITSTANNEVLRTLPLGPNQYDVIRV